MLHRDPDVQLAIDALIQSGSRDHAGVKRRLRAQHASREIAERYGVSAKSVRRRKARLGMGKAAEQGAG